MPPTGGYVSGHSKWSTIKRKKGAADAKRGQLFSKLSRAIIVAAREGGPDPDGNLALQNAVEKAREASMPKENIERAIARGAGTGSEAANYEAVTYEGYGPGGVAILVEVLTDNRNRTAAEVRHVFTKYEGKLGTSGAVAWQFERKGVVLVPEVATDEDDLVLVAADGGAEDVELNGETFHVTAEPDDLVALRGTLEEAGIAFESADLTMVPKSTVEIADESVARRLLKLVDELDDNEDVQGTYANFDIAEQLMNAVA